MTDNLLESAHDAPPASAQQTLPHSGGGVPEEFLDPETGAVRVNDLLRAYHDLKRTLDSVPRAPESPEAYCVTCEHGLFQADPDINARLHAQGFSEAQVQTVYDLAAEKLVPMILDVAGDFQADREVERLVETFGGADQWRETARQLLAFGRKSLPPDVLEGLAGTYEGVMALHRMMTAKTPSISARESTPAPLTEGDLGALMRDPRYWKNKDPAFIAKVSEGFREIYGK